MTAMPPKTPARSAARGERTPARICVMTKKARNRKTAVGWWPKTSVENVKARVPRA
jgi:hypothetical protein